MSLLNNCGRQTAQKHAPAKGLLHSIRHVLGFVPNYPGATPVYFTPFERYLWVLASHPPSKPELFRFVRPVPRDSNPPAGLPRDFGYVLHLIIPN